MTKKEKRIRAIIDFWKPKLFIQDWDVTLKIEDKDEGDMAGECEVNFDYRCATIRVFPCFFKEIPKVQDTIILHELTHIILAPYGKIHNELINGRLITVDHESQIKEQTTTWITNILENLNTDKPSI